MVYLLLADGFEETEALVPLDLLRRGGCEVKTVGITGKTVTGSHGIRVEADCLPEEAVEAIDALIFPGGMPGAKNLDESAAAKALLTRALQEKSVIGAICAAPAVVLGQHGLLRGERAVCFPGFEPLMAGASLSEERVVTSGVYTTAVGMGAAYEFGLALLARLAGEKRAEEIRRAALIP